MYNMNKSDNNNQLLKRHKIYKVKNYLSARIVLFLFLMSAGSY